MSKKLIINLTPMIDPKVKWYQYDTTVLKDVLTFFGTMYIDKVNKQFTPMQLSKAVFFALDKWFNCGDDIASYLIAKYYYDKYDEINVYDICEMYFSYINIMRDIESYEKTFKLTPQKYEELEKECKNYESLHSIISQCLNINLSKEETEYIYEHLTTLTVLSKTDENGVSRRLIYKPIERLKMLTNLLGYLFKKDSKGTSDTSESTSNEKVKQTQEDEQASSNNDAQIAVAVKAKIW